MTETLYNGIVLPDDGGLVWPPTTLTRTNVPLPEAPYITTPPPVIPIDVGRQLPGLDDFLIDPSDAPGCSRVQGPTWTQFVGNPVLPYGGITFPFSLAYGGYVGWDPNAGEYRAWYEEIISGVAGNVESRMALRTSADGKTWSAPTHNILNTPDRIDSFNFFIGGVNAPDLGPLKKYILTCTQSELVSPLNYKLTVWYSSDGITWAAGPAFQSVGLGNLIDRTTVHWNPYRQKWVLSLRTIQNPVNRYRRYREADAADLEPLLDIASTDDAVIWRCADTDDPPNPACGNLQPDLYNIDGLAYESTMLGLIVIHDWETLVGNIKLNKVEFASMRDGFYLQRDFRTPVAIPTLDINDWNGQNLQPATPGLQVIDDDTMRMYVTAVRMEPPGGVGPLGASVGIYSTRRDGFAAFRMPGAQTTVLTRVVKWSNDQRFFFLNCDARHGKLDVDVVYENGDPTGIKFIRTVGNPTKQRLRLWGSATTIRRLQGQNVRIRFRGHDVDVYAFWVSTDTQGTSGGYVPGPLGPIG